MIQIFLEGRKWVQFDPICILEHLALLNDAKTLVRCWTGNLMQPHAVWCLVEGPEVCVTHHCYYLLWRSKNGHCVCMSLLNVRLKSFPSGIHVRFVTNETQRTRDSLVEKLHKNGFSMPKENV